MGTEVALSHSDITSLSTSTWECRGSRRGCGGQGMKEARPSQGGAGAA